MLKSNWNLHQLGLDDVEIKRKSAELGVCIGTAKTLLSRGIDSREKLDLFLSEGEGTQDPFLLPDMLLCVERIKKAIDNREKILIYGDYDADGVTSVAVLYLFLKEKGGEVYYHVPDRFIEGYGMNREVIKNLPSEGISLIVTVDTGVSCRDEISYAKSFGIDTVVSDHHECLNGIPDDALAVVNPQRPDYNGYKGYSGVGVAFMIAMAFEAMESSLEKARELIYEKYADIAAIGTVADVMSLTGENKAIVKKGLGLMESGKCHKGITALLVAAKGSGSKVTSQTIGFVLGPRINAAGRMSHASLVVELLIASDYGKCCEIADKLCKLNSQRQASENEILKEACLIIEKEQKQKNSVIVVGSEDWNHGVIGIVCSRIVEKYKKPAILFSLDGDNAKGSGRSLEGLNLARAIDHCSEYVLKYGGHELAAGLTVERSQLADFEKAINKYADELNLTFGKAVVMNIDARLYPNEMTLPFAKELEMLEPFGQDNPQPLFLLTDARVDEIKLLSQGKHTRYILSSDRISFEALMFNFNGEDEGIKLGDRLSIVFTVEVNEYMGKKKLSINVKDFCFDEETEKKLEYFEGCYFSLEQLPGKRLGELIPLRKDFVPVYKMLALRCADGECSFGYRSLIEGEFTLSSYIRLRIILDVLNGCGLINVTYYDRYKIRCRVCKTEKKINIEESEQYLKLKSRINS